MKIILVLLVAATVSSQAVSFLDSLLTEWDTFKITHGRKYKSVAEEQFRLKVFEENRRLIAKHNVQYEMGLVSFKLDLNKYGDMLHHEFVSTLNGFNKSRGLLTGSAEQPIGATFIIPAHVEIPNDVDWTIEGAVTPVKDQGACGSCWAFSAIGALEGQHFRKDGILVLLSEQNLIDCSAKNGNNGCGGGLMNNAFEYIKDNGGIDTEESYPYEGHKNECRYDPKNAGATDVGFTDIPIGDEEKLKAAVATVGPVSVAIDASHQSFQFYSEGVYYEPNCSLQDLDHGVLAVGYGTSEDGDDYWLVKNSWGKSWGDAGFIKMARNKNNNCGIATSASYPLV